MFWQRINLRLTGTRGSAPKSTIDFTSLCRPLTFGDTMEFGRREILVLPGLAGTVEILEFLCEHKTARYMDFDIPISYHSLNTRLKQMLDMGLIEHHLTKEEVRREWYTITERGKKYLKLIQAQLDLFKS